MSDPYQFKAGDRVTLTPAAVRYYGGAPPWVPFNQGGGEPGTVAFAGDRPHKPGAEPRPYFVEWDNGAGNSYREGDLQAAVDPEDAPPSNVIPFGRGPAT
ncbi:MAG TPA: hypothetical protein VK188_06920 [Holophaga sp.]|nr:hypothetical protein [Holophaga sp.]